MTYVTLESGNIVFLINYLPVLTAGNSKKIVRESIFPIFLQKCKAFDL
jgi:hypothetical protein